MGVMSGVVCVLYVFGVCVACDVDCLWYYLLLRMR
jgi:hypothetical protein